MHKSSSPKTESQSLAPQGIVMLRSFSVENYLSFREKTTLDLRVPKAQADYGWAVKRAGKDYLGTIAGIFGANASGKTNILKALYFVKAFFRDSFRNALNQDFPIKAWAESKEPILFEMQSEDDAGKIFIYKLELTEQEVLKEELRVRLLEEKGQGQIAFLRKKDEIISALPEFAFLKEMGLRLRQNVSLFSTFLQFKPENSWRHLSSGGTNVSSSGRIPWEDISLLTTSVYYKDKTLKGKALEYLKRFDIGLENIEIEEEKGHLVPYGIHNLGKNGSFKIPFTQESGGTKVLYNLFSYLVALFERGGLLVIDELEAELHPDIVDYLILLFADENVNKAHAQLVFSSHFPEIMNLTGKNLTWFTEKKDGESQLIRLSDYEGVRMDENYPAKYRAGKWGGIPTLS